MLYCAHVRILYCWSSVASPVDYYKSNNKRNVFGISSSRVRPSVFVRRPVKRTHNNNNNSSNNNAYKVYRDRCFADGRTGNECYPVFSVYDVDYITYTRYRGACPCRHPHVLKCACNLFGCFGYKR